MFISWLTGQDKGIAQNRKLRWFVEKQGCGTGVKKRFDKTNIQRNKNAHSYIQKTEWWLPEGKGGVEDRTKGVKGIRYMVMDGDWTSVVST